MSHPSSPESTVQQPLLLEDPISPFQSEMSHPSSPQTTEEQIPVLEHPGSPMRLEMSHLSSPQATVHVVASQLSSSPQATVQDPPVLEHPASPLQLEMSHPSSPQATVLEHPTSLLPSSPQARVQQPPVLEHLASPLQLEMSHLSSPQSSLQQSPPLEQLEEVQQPRLEPPPPPLSIHSISLNLWLIVLVIVGLVSLSIISWGIYTWHRKDADIWCTNPNVTVTKEGNAPSHIEGDAPVLFRTIMAAVDAAPGDSEWPFCILIQKGVYHERILIERNKKNLVLVGEGINKTIISSNGGVVSTTRFISELATLWVLGKRFKARDISFENMGADQLHSVALKNSGDQSVFYRCSFRSQRSSIHSDNVGQQLYHDCYISGSQYLIYGNGRALFQRSTIHINNLETEVGAVVALQERRSNFIFGGGFVFHLCTFSASTQKPINYLGASSGSSSLIVVMQSYLDRSISPLGWLVENMTRSIYFGEYQNRGPGARRERTSPNLQRIQSLKDASSFTIRNFLNVTAWLLCKDIPCNLDLLQDWNNRQQFASPSYFHADAVNEYFISQAVIENTRAYTILKQAPYLVLFTSRVKIFTSQLAAARQRDGSHSVFTRNRFRIRQDHILEDAFNQLSVLSEDDLQGLHYEGGISELELYFVIVNNKYGEQTEEELLPGGKNIGVTNENVSNFIIL